MKKMIEKLETKLNELSDLMPDKVTSLDVSNNDFKHGLCPMCEEDWDGGLEIHRYRKLANSRNPEYSQYLNKTDEELSAIRHNEINDMCEYMRNNGINENATADSFSDRISNLRNLILGGFSKHRKDGYICPFCRTAWYKDSGAQLTDEERDYYNIHYV